MDASGRNSSSNSLDNYRLSPSLLRTLDSVPVRKARAPHRTRIPDKPDIPFNIWSILKSAIGKDLSRMTIPVNFAEPVSMLQRLTENFQYSGLLDKAAQCADTLEQMCYIAAFSVTSYGSCADRMGKPFNPLLGETYECDRSVDLGWRCFSEQVGHHPPICALHCEGAGWTLWQELSVESKFKGNYLELFPVGVVNLKFADSGSHYTWGKVSTYVRNLIIGKLWVDNEGEVEIVNQVKGEKCTVIFHPNSTFGKARKVTGNVMDQNGDSTHTIQGSWDKYIDVMKVKKEDFGRDRSFQPGKEYRLWTYDPPPPASEGYYNMSEFACQLNELEESVAPTDSRLRPDQRLLELGKWEQAQIMKEYLEDRQRSRRRRSIQDSGAPDEDTVQEHLYHQPLWFDREMDSKSGKFLHVFKGTYWKQKQIGDWSMCPKIFTV